VEQKTPGTARGTASRPASVPARSRHRAAVGALFATLLALSLWGPQARPAAAQANTVAVVGADRLALRRGPGKEFPGFDTLKAGTRIEIEEIEGEWARVITPNGQRGYVHSNFLQIPGEPPAAVAPPVIESPRPAPTATAARPTERKRPATLTPTPTAKKRATATPSRTATKRSGAADSDATGTSERARQLSEEVSALNARNAALEAELRSAQESLAAGRASGTGPTPAAAADTPTELARLTATVDALQKQLETQTARASAAAGGGAAGADVRQGLSGTTVGAGVLGVAIGWVLGTMLGRRSDRSRRSRIRF